MRKITNLVVSAFYGGENFKMSNTDVETYNWVTTMYLHNNTIATIEKDKLTLDDCGWQTNTTKERLNWILEGIWCIRQKDFVWYLLLNNGEVYKFDDVESINIKTNTVTLK